MSTELWPILDRLVQWLIIPLGIALWSLYSRFESKTASHDKEILKLVTIMEERNIRAIQQQEDWNRIVNRLEQAVEKLSDKIDVLNSKGS